MGLYWLLSPVCAFLVFLATPRVIAIHLQPTPRQVNSPFKPGFERQAVSSHGRLPPGALIDTCASIDIGLVAELGPLIGLKILDGVLTESRLCLCVTDLDFYLDTSNDMIILKNLVGRDTLKEFLEVLIKTSPNRKECNRANITYTHVADSCTCTHSLCGKNSNVKSSTVALSTSPSDPIQATTGRELHGETAGHAGVNADPYTECLPFSECDGWTGNSCRRTPNVKEASYTNGRCFISACTDGWTPSTGRDACVKVPKVLSPRMRRVKARDTGNDGVTLDSHVIVNLTRIIRALSNLRIHSNSLHKNSTLANTSVVLLSTDEIIQVGTKFFLSHSINSLLNHTAELFNLAQWTIARQSDCAFSKDIKLDLVNVDLDVLVDLTADILGRYRYSADERISISSDPSLSDVPITISLSQLFDVLDLGSVGTIIRASSPGSELGNGPLGVHSTGPSRKRRESVRSLGTDSLLEQVRTLARLVLQLGDLGSLLPSNAENSAKLASLTPVSLATLGLVTSTDVSGLSSSLDLVVLASSKARMTLSRYGDCGALVDELSLVVKTAIAIKASCEEFPLSQEIKFPFSISSLELEPPSAPTVQASTTNAFRQPKGTPVVVVLDGLLHRLGLSGVSANMTIDGLDSGLSSTLTGALSLLHVGARKVAREEDGEFSSVIFSDPGLAKAFTAAVETVTDLRLKSADPGPVASLLAGLLPPVLASLQAVLDSPTVTGLVSVVDDLLGSAKKMDTLLTNCNCATVLVLESSGRFVTAVMAVQSWVDEHS